MFVLRKPEHNESHIMDSTIFNKLRRVTIYMSFQNVILKHFEHGQY